MSLDEKLYFGKLFELAEEVCPREEWKNEFVIYSIFKSRFTLLLSLTQNRTNDKKVGKIIHAYDYVMLTFLMVHFGGDQALIEKYMETRMSAYETIFLKYPNKVFALTRAGGAFRWYLVNHSAILPEGENDIPPYDEHTFSPLPIDHNAFSQNEAKVINDFDNKLLNFFAVEHTNFLKYLKKVSRKI